MKILAKKQNLINLKRTKINKKINKCLTNNEYQGLKQKGDGNRILGNIIADKRKTQTSSELLSD